MFERYTERARRVIFFARFEASKFGSMNIETEHLLLGLLREDRNLTNRFLPNLSSAKSLRNEIEGRITIREKVSTTIDLPVSDECKRILAYAAEEAERLSNRHIGTEHLLLGLLREENCVAAQVLSELGLRLNAVRQDLARAPMPQDPEASPNIPPMFPLTPLMQSPALPKPGVVPDADTAARIAEAVWIPLYGAETVKTHAPFQAELKHNVWIVIGSPAAGSSEALFAFILQADGRLLSVGGPHSDEY